MYPGETEGIIHPTTGIMGAAMRKVFLEEVAARAHSRVDICQRRRVAEPSVGAEWGRKL